MTINNSKSNNNNLCKLSRNKNKNHKSQSNRNNSKNKTIIKTIKAKIKSNKCMNNLYQIKRLKPKHRKNSIKKTRKTKSRNEQDLKIFIDNYRELHKSIYCIETI